MPMKIDSDKNVGLNQPAKKNPNEKQAVPITPNILGPYLS